MINGNWKRLSAALLAATMLLVNSGAVFAQQSIGQGLEISPPLVEQSANPGQALIVTIRLRNITKGTLVTTSAINDFVAAGETGQAKLELSPTAEPSPYSLKTWVGDIPSLTLQPGTTQTVNIAVNVPKGASPGGHYGVIRFTGNAPGVDSSGVSLSASLGTLVLIKVSGKVVDNATIASFYATRNGKQTSFFESGPVGLRVRLQNKGNVHFQPTGTIRITNTFGKETAVLPINPSSGNVLPASIRRFDQTLNKKSLFGHYTAKADIQYDGKALSQSTGFWVIPYKLVLIVIGAILIAIAVIRYWVKKTAQSIVRKSQPKKPKK